MAPRPRPAEERFWEKVAKDDASGCWVWTAGISSDGYGAFGSGLRSGPQVRAHRYSWELANGPIPKGALVCHACDVRRCVNPAHLFLGSAKENTHDMLRKRRNDPTVGEKNGMAKLSLTDVEEIRRLTKASGLSQGRIAAMFSVNQSTVSRIHSGQRWDAI